MNSTVDNLSTVENAGSRWKNAAEKQFLQRMQKKLAPDIYRSKKKTIITKIFRIRAEWIYEN